MQVHINIDFNYKSDTTRIESDEKWTNNINTFKMGVMRN